MFRTIIITTIIFFGVSIAPAQTSAQTTAQPIEITADRALEWHRNDSRYIADGNAMVKQGEMTLRGDHIAADYRDGAKGGVEIYRMTATGNVSIDNGGTIATGDVAVYEVDSGLATLTGKALRLSAPDQVITARDKFEYDIHKGTFRAIGTARAVREGNVLDADTITAIFSDGANGAQTLNRIEAVGNVVITTPDEVLSGTRGVYDAARNHAVMTGNVKIVRGLNTLTGERAELDMKTNVSRMFGSSIEDGQTGGRVRGVFYPDSTGER